MKEEIINSLNRGMLKLQIIVSGLYSIIHFTKDIHYTPAILMSSCILGLFIFIRYKLIKQSYLNIIIGLLLLTCVTVMVIVTGGSNAPAVIWYLPVLMYIYIVNPKRTKLFFFSFTIFTYGLLYLLTKTNNLPQSVMPQDMREMMYFINFVLCSFVLYFNANKNEELFSIQNKQLEESLQRNELLIKGVNVGVFDWSDTNSTKGVYWSPKLYEIMGMEDQEIPASTDFYMTRIHTDDLQEMIEGNTKQLAEGNILKSETRIKRKDGVYRWINTRCYVVKDENGHPTRYVGAVTDIDESVKSKIHLKQAKEEAEKATKAKTVFLENMTHEIRTPLNAVIGLTEVLQEKNLSDEQKELIDDISNSGNQLMGIITDILDFSKIENKVIDLELQEVNLSDFFKGIDSIHSELCHKSNIHYTTNSKDFSDYYYKTDRLKLTQVMNNLLGNALKFTKAEGSISILITPKEESLSVDITDTGIGIKADEIEKIFTPFEQASNSDYIKYIGTGLGLAICKNFIEAMGGTIKVSSTEAKGSTFSFSIKSKRIIKKHIPEKKREHKSSPLELLQKNQYVLVVEDNDLNLKVMSNYLKSLNLKFDIAKNGEEAVHCCHQNKYDLIFMDLQMPVLNGNQATEQIREFNKEIIIVALTANAFGEARDKAFASGMNDFMSKPVKKKDIIGVLNKFSKVA